MLVTKTKGVETEIIKAWQDPSIVIVTDGKGTLKADGIEHEVKGGYVFFIGYHVESDLTAMDGLKPLWHFEKRR